MAQDIRIMTLPKVDDLMTIHVGDAAAPRSHDAKRVGIKQSCAVAHAIDEDSASGAVELLGLRVLDLIFLPQSSEKLF